MKHSFRVVMTAAGCLIIGLLVTMGAISCSHTKEAAKREPLTGGKILDDFVKVTGGLERHDKIFNRYTKAMVSIPAAGLDLGIEIYNARPNKLFSVASSDALGEISNGTDGVVYWENSIMSGPRILEGDELTSALREAAIDRLTHWRDYYTSAELVGTDTIDGAVAYKVVMEPTEGETETSFFDRKTGLLVRVESTYKHEMGDLPLIVTMGDYREVDGVMMPYSTVVAVMGQDRKVTVEEIRHNIDMPDTLFAIPPEIQELMEN